MLNVSATQQQQQLIERLESKLADQADEALNQALKMDALEARLNALENR